VWDEKREVLTAASTIRREQREGLLSNSKPGLLWTTRVERQADYVLIERDGAVEVLYLERNFFDP
jgi:hypothetical protein